MSSNAQWSDRKISDLAEIEPGGTPSTVVAEYWNGDNFWATPTDITASKGKYISETARKISNSGLSHVSKVLPVGSILLCTRATIGDSRINTVPITTNQGFKNLVPKAHISNEWLYYALQTKIEEMISLSSGSTFLELGTKQLGNIEISTPDFHEQKAIAKALSDIDELIEGFKLEIAKAENVKESVCSPLVLGQARLRGFTVKWIESSLGDELGYEQPTKYLVNTTEHQESGNVPVLTAGKSFILGYSDDTDGVYANTPTILFDDFTTDSKFVDFEFKVKSSACKMLKNNNPKGNLRFFHTLMQYLEFRPYDHKRYWISEYSKIEILVPDPIEQNAIAEVIEDFENQIRLLKSELAKFECIKQGMAHDLLTGKVRLA